jgi:hypothetical protein
MAPANKLIEETTTIEVPTPVQVPDLPVYTVAASAEADLEYIQSEGWGPSNWVRTLPPDIDDLMTSFGTDIYDKMENEPIVNSSVGILVSAAYAQEPEIIPAVDEDDAEYEDAMRLANFCGENLARLQDEGFMPYLYEMASGGFTHGHKISELVYELGDSKYVTNKGQLYMLDRLKTKPQTSTAFAVDPFGNTVGYMYGRYGGISIPGYLAPVSDRKVDGSISNMLPPQKVAVFRYMTHNGDPRGSSGLRPAYHPWWMMQEAYDNLKKYIRMFGIPPTWSTLPPNVVDQIKDRDGNDKQQSAAQTQNQALIKMRGGSNITLGHGATVNIHEPRSGGEIFMNSITMQEGRIIKAITFQELATSGSPGTRASSAIHQDMFGIRTQFIKRRSAAFIRNQVFARLVMLNFGPKFMHLVPDTTLGLTEQTDFAVVAIAMARLFAAGFLQEDQLPEIYEDLNLPASALINEQIRARQIELAMQQMIQKIDPETGKPTDQYMPAPVAAASQARNVSVGGNGMGAAGDVRAPQSRNSQRPAQGLRVVGKRGRSRKQWGGSEPGVGGPGESNPQYGMPGNMG